MEQISEENISTIIQDLADANGHETRVSYTDGNRWAVNYIKETFESFDGLTSVTLDTFFASNATFPFDTEPLFNVVATLEGTVAPSQIYIIGGHVDATANLDNNLNWESDWLTAKAPGADDNATGIAAILEIARVLSDPANEFDAPVTIKFVAFGAEERHPAYDNRNHLGSRHFVQQSYSHGDDILGAYILDMIGHNSTGHDYFNIVSDTRSKELGEKMLEVNSVYQVGLSSNQPPFPEATYSDHDQFWLYRYKAILLIENAPPWQNNPPWYAANPFYHRRTDTFATLNVSQVTKLAKLTLSTVASLSGVVTSVETPREEVRPPQTFTLLQNYPNPFNAGTLIRYRLHSNGNVKLSIYNLQGQEVINLVDQLQPAGEYSLVWNGKDAQGQNLSSGMYLYSLKVGDRRSVKKMILSK
nr:M20/M25/M40 family metallo-hydrolase [candidate division KSB1 bacterium]NIR70429.1 M20/M25/M40 family metallo-hydrolase [candidate division KSB1 bacterium]NIS28100.1 M20/M25/M40 family metallo-hydrolase [candidate division KSB1 bacterium]NIT74980.1 M20/M25/M40 family metallo-hydrolase [candidate division KSB1 bacterium]NIU28784.1 M20/M25/M40 family metallo-hydrolase [candidate division KSB1 bacterium]